MVFTFGKENRSVEVGRVIQIRVQVVSAIALLERIKNGKVPAEFPFLSTLFVHFVIILVLVLKV